MKAIKKRKKALKEIIKGLDSLVKKGWVVDEYELSQPPVDDVKAQYEMGFNAMKSGPEIYINMRLTNTKFKQWE